MYMYIHVHVPYICVLAVITGGYGTMTFASADKYIGYWRDGIRHGKVCVVIDVLSVSICLRKLNMCIYILYIQCTCTLYMCINCSIVTIPISNQDTLVTEWIVQLRHCAATFVFLGSTCSHLRTCTCTCTCAYMCIRAW